MGSEDGRVWQLSYCLLHMNGPLEIHYFSPEHLDLACVLPIREHVCAHAGFYAMTSFHLIAKDRPSIYKPFEVAAFLGFFAW